jgi:hypothetical protein
MIDRPFWIKRIEVAWEQAPIVWLTGVRRVGKTVLAQSLPERAEFLNCDLPSTADRLADPERFFGSLDRKVVVLDEVHQLADPSRLLKIAADAFPQVKVLATGSSTLAATRKFRDSLTGRKRTVHLTPVLVEELPSFGVADLRDRLRYGGLPPVLLAGRYQAEFYAEWMDSYYARDVQELFRLGKRNAFLKLLELVLRQSGGMLDVTAMASAVGGSRPTVMKWLDVLQVTYAAHLLRPYAVGGKREIVGQPKFYGFDTGFVCHARGWDALRTDDCGILWEHLVLDTLLSVPSLAIHFWRDKQHREVDFVIPRGRGVVDAIECKWNARNFDARGLAAFRSNYPKGRNFIISPQMVPAHDREINQLEITFASLPELRGLLAPMGGAV